MPALAHLGVGLITKYFKPKINVWILLTAAMMLDLLTIIFSKALWPTHGLNMAIIWSIIFSIISGIVLNVINKIRQEKYQIFYTSIIIGLVVFSHWVLDFIGWPMSIAEEFTDGLLTGMPFFFSDEPNFGLGAYRTWLGGLTIEIGFFLTGIILYVKYFIEKRRKSKIVNKV